MWVDWMKLRQGWDDKYPELATWVRGLDERKEFAETRPVMFDLSEAVV